VKRQLPNMITSMRLLPALLFVLVLLAACRPQPVNPQPNCTSGQEIRPGNLYTGRKEALATVGTLCSDKDRYQLGETAHFTMTVKNALDESIILGNGQSPVLDIETERDHNYRSNYPPLVPTRIKLQPGQVYAVNWDWPPPDVDVNKAKDHLGWVYVYGDWVGLDGMKGSLRLRIGYGPIVGPP
jgi:hypothetical protein